MKGENPNKQDSHSTENVNVLPILESEAVVCDKYFVKKTIVEFILKLYQDKCIQCDGLVPKKTVKEKFETFVNTSNCRKHFPHLNVGTLMRECTFLHNTPRGSSDFCISMKSVFKFLNENLKLFDNLCLSEISIDMNSDEIDDKSTESAKEACVYGKDLNGMDTMKYDLSTKDVSKTNIEQEKIADFVLKLYHDLYIQPNGLVARRTLWREFHNFVKAHNYEEIFSNQNIGKLLYENKCLVNTPRSCQDFRISFKRIFEYRNEKLKLLDDMHKNYTSENKSSLETDDKPIEASIEVSANAEEFPLVFQGGCTQEVDADFKLINLGCYICQKNFKTQSAFEDHISIHGFESDFEFLTTLKRMENIFEINYRLCNKSHYFYFTMNTKKRDVIIEKIIIVQSRSMQFVKNDLVPYELASDGIDSFLVDSHLFTIGVEQPVVVIYRYKSNKLMRFVEQHHFLRIEEFPQVHFCIRSCRVSDKTLMKNKFKLGEYYPDPAVKVSQKDNFSDESLSKVSDHFRNYLRGEKLNEQNICNVLKIKLQIEDLEGAKDYLPLYQKAAQIKRFGREYSVKLKKIPKNIFLENIVSPLDEIILTATETKIEPGNKSNRRNKKAKEYKAMIERVYYDTVCFKYDDSTIDENQKYDITLRPSRLSLKYQFRALELLSFNLEKKLYLFPVDGHFRKCLTNEKLELFNPSIKSNDEQLQAVRNIAVGPDVSAPYVIFGPPGTGKTTTIVETVLQLWKRRPDTRVLITAGSNSACDEVAIRLCRVLNEIQPEKPNILRIFAKSNEKRLDSIEDILIDASNFYRAHFYPSVESIREYRIIVCTLSIVGKLVSAAIGSTFFTHIFIDECAASTEPEVLVGWMGTSSSNTRLIVSGDHKQLGPILKSTRAADLGLTVSFMERLLNRKCYEVDENGNYDRSIQTRLIRNYRSHPEIVGLYNGLYYNNELKPLANKDDTIWGLQWHMLPNRNHPIIFHSVYGSCGKNVRSVSLCNEQEVNAVMDYVKDLMYFGLKGRKIEETDIGIISPYKKQYTRIQEELNSRRWNRIEVGAVETFQGKEKPIIIVSTVRSFTKTLGFLENPRRLNVILSRAQALLIMIGNPKTLSKNKDFKYIIDECTRNNCIRGGGGLSVMGENGTNKISLAGGSIETNLNSNNLHTKPKSSRKRTQNKKYDSKLKKSPVLKETKKKTVLSENFNENNIEVVSQTSSNISNPFKIVENNSNYVNSYFNPENIGTLAARVESKPSFSEFVTERNDQYKTIKTHTLKQETMHKTTTSESFLINQDSIVTPLLKPQATVFPRRHFQEHFITSPSRVPPRNRERDEIDVSWEQPTYVNVIKKPEKRGCVIA